MIGGILRTQLNCGWQRITSTECEAYIKINFNGSEYTLVDSLDRSYGWTRDKEKADKILEAVEQYKLWTDIPKSIRMQLSFAGFGPK